MFFSSLLRLPKTRCEGLYMVTLKHRPQRSPLPAGTGEARDAALADGARDLGLQGSAGLCSCLFRPLCVLTPPCDNEHEGSAPGGQEPSGREGLGKAHG